MGKSFLLALALGLSASTTLVADESKQSFRLDFAQARAALGGDADALAYLSDCAEQQYVCAMLAGRANKANERHDAAIEMLQRALELGYPDAAFELQGTEFLSGNLVESFAWGQLAILLSDPKQERSRDEIRERSEFMMLAEAWHGMDEAEQARAEKLAQSRIARWQEVVRERAERDPKQNIEILRAVNPEYPRHLAEGGTNGYALVYLEFAADGEVIDAIEMGYSHRDFGREARRAAKRWKLGPSAGIDPLAGTAVQRVDFVMPPRSSRG